MKKVFILLFTCVLVLMGCGSSDKELNVFVNDFNKRASSEDVPELIPEDFGEIEEEEDEYWKTLYESDKYEITVYYDKKKKIIGYHLSTNLEEILLEGKGYNASLALAKSLGISVKDFSKNLGKAMDTDVYTYEENGYEVNIVNLGWDSSVLTSVIIGFDKKD